jgi:hydroxybutyrate-dimer hydrolase
MKIESGAHPARLAPLRLHLLGLTIASTCLFGFAGQHSARGLNIRPAWLGEITTMHYAGSDDLLTAGLGKSGLAGPMPSIAVPGAPTPAELRRLVIYANYRALIDMTAAGGYGRLYGPNIDLAGNDTLGEGLIPGTEYLVFAKNVAGTRNVTLMVQVPDSFDPGQPCIVTATSSGSRGVYGAIGAAGEWGLKRNCAVAYSDKGTGAGAHELDSDLVTLIDGTLATAAEAGDAALFAAETSDAERAAYVAAHPNRYAMKHAHSGDNPERIWGRATLRAIEFAFYVLNERFDEPINPKNTLVIAASVSNGGGASLAAAEEDHRELIDAVVVQEPQIHVKHDRRVLVMRGGQPVGAFGKPLLDYITYANLLQPCAAVAPSNADSPLLAFHYADPTSAHNRCTALANAGFVGGATTAERAEDAKARLVAYGWEPESALLHASHYGFSAAPAVSVTYANTYKRASVFDNLCGYSMATTDAAGRPAAAAASPMATVWALSNGVPPSTGINLIAEDAMGGPIREPLGVSMSTGLADYYFDGALCLRGLLQDPTIKASIADIELKGRLHGKPTLIVHGRTDTQVPVNHTSRPYLGLNDLRERGRSRLSYIEVTNAQHFESFLPIAGYDTRLIPLHWYGIQALNLMWSHLTAGTPLPPSQLVRTIPRGGVPGAAPAITTANLPPIALEPASGDAITVEHGVVNVPD